MNVYTFFKAKLKKENRVLNRDSAIKVFNQNLRNNYNIELKLE
jgi:hypothetical protein